MAVKNEFVTDNVEAKAADTCIAARTTGSIMRTVFFNFEVAAADDNASIYRLCTVSGKAIPVRLTLLNDSIAGFTNPSVGIYKQLGVGGAVIDVDILMAATDLNAGLATPGTQKFAPAIADVGKNLLQLAGVSDADLNKYGSVDIAITTAAGVSAAGTVSGFFEYAEGV